MSDNAQNLRQAAEEIRREGHAGWGNACEWAADEIERLRDLVAGFDDGGHWYSQQTMDAVVRERDELRRQLAEARAEREAMANVLPGHCYMDPPDGGDVPVLEQLRRMAKDAARYRWLRGREDGRYMTVYAFRTDIDEVCLGDELDAAIDAAMGGSNE